MHLNEIYSQTVAHFLSPILPLLDDPEVSEVLINGYQTVYFEKEGRLVLSDLVFPSEESLKAAVTNIAEYVNRVIDDDHHSMDARLPPAPKGVEVSWAGSRVHVIVPPSSRGGCHVSIRKFKKSTFNLQSLVKAGSLSEAAAEFLKMVVLIHKNTVISGGTGTGKTSMLNALSAAIPEYERIIVIEDSSELQLHQPHTFYLEAQPARPDGRGAVSIRDLFVDSLRMRPDRIVVGEVRRGEALDMIQSMISGHSGALTTAHANTPFDALIRLETMVLMSGVEMPVHVVRRQIASAVQVIVQLTRFDDGSRRVSAISEVLGLEESGNYIVQPLYVFVPSGRDSEGKIQGGLKWSGVPATFSAEPYQLDFGKTIQHCSDVLPKPVA
jgi:pilus assembly protein CpaF